MRVAISALMVSSAAMGQAGGQRASGDSTMLRGKALQDAGQSGQSLEMGGPSYPNVTLRSEAIAVTWFLPPQANDSVAYYKSTRFDWGSMIGDVRIGQHTLYGSNFWRSPSDPNWQAPHDPTLPEAGVGLAAEFGCGGNGASCGPGWDPYTNGASNGVLGYEEAGAGEPFLKIGVGKLLKGSCPRCTDDEYKFNSAYKFAEWPVWNVSSPGPAADALEMVHEASLNTKWGYRLKVRVSVQGNALIAERELTNIGSQAFATPQYSHNFLSADNRPVGPPFQLTFGQNVSDYTEPGVISEYKWAKPIAGYFRLLGANTLQAVPPESSLSDDPPRLKAELSGATNMNSSASFVASLGGVTMASDTISTKASLYAYNLYVESTAVCPEPIQMLELNPGETATWRQHLLFGEFEPASSNTQSACRGADADDTSTSYYTLHFGVETINECKALCLERHDCVGIEHGQFGTGRCEVWTREAGIQATEQVPGFTCLRRVMARPEEQVILP